MMPLSLSQTIADTLPLVGNHLWQSTLVAAIVGLVALALRENRAQVRHALWLVASMKFLVPFAALAGLGRAVAARPHATILATLPEMARVVEATSRRLSWTEVQMIGPVGPIAVAASRSGVPLVVSAIWVAGCAAVLARWCVRWRHVARVARSASTLTSGREVDILRRVEQTAGLEPPLAIASTSEMIEPGVFGLRAGTVLLWPRAISAHLDDRHIEAIMSHEVSHVQRRDNLTAAAHMLVEAVFWFHPLVWWIGARLIDERERACDEAVLLAGGSPELYAEGILTTCRLSVESSLACVAGVTGSNLKKRIERIMTREVGTRLSSLRRRLLGTMAAAAFVAPVAAGAIAPRDRAEVRSEWTPALQSGDQGSAEFEVASVKANKSGDGRVMMSVQPGGRFTATNITVRMLIRNAYALQEFQISGGPGWLNSDHFDIVAKGEGDFGDAFQAEQRQEPSRLQLMLRALLADRFGFKAHSENQEMSIYALLVARGDGRLGPQLKRSEVDCQAAVAGAARGSLQGPPPRPEQRQSCGMRIRPGNLSGGGVTLSQFAGSLSMFAGRIVVDRTALVGNFDIDLSWTPDQMPQRPPGAPDLAPIDPNGPSIFTAVQEQLGLKLDSQKGPVSVLVIDHIEPPTPN